MQVKLFSTKEPPVVEVRVDRKTQGERERTVVELAAIDAFDFTTNAAGAERQALVVRFAVPHDALTLERASGAAAEWQGVPLGEDILGKNKKDNKKKSKKKKKKKSDEQGENAGDADGNGDQQKKIEIELRIEGDDAKRARVKEAFLVALAKAKEAAVKGTLTLTLA